MSEFHDIIKTFRSFLNVRRIFDGEIALSYLETPFTKEKFLNTTMDRFFGISALKFKEDLVYIIKNVKSFCELWKYLYANFLSNPACVHLSPDQKVKFQGKVDELNQLTKHKLSHRSE
jgi:hypothetical protein